MAGGFHDTNFSSPQDKDASSSVGYAGQSSDQDLDLPEITEPWAISILNQTKEPEIITINDDDLVPVNSVEYPFSIYNSDNENQMEMNNNIAENCILKLDATSIDTEETELRDTSQNSIETPDIKSNFLKNIMDYFSQILVILRGISESLEKETSNFKLATDGLGVNIQSVLEQLSCLDKDDESQLALQRYCNLIMTSKRRMTEVYEQLSAAINCFITERMLNILSDKSISLESNQPFELNDILMDSLSNTSHEILLSIREQGLNEEKNVVASTNVSDVPKCELLSNAIVNNVKEEQATMPEQTGLLLHNNPPVYKLSTSETTLKDAETTFKPVSVDTYSNLHYSECQQSSEQNEASNNKPHDLSNAFHESLPTEAHQDPFPLGNSENLANCIPVSSADVYKQNGNHNFILNNQPGAIALFISQQEREMLAAKARVEHPLALTLSNVDTSLKNCEKTSESVSTNSESIQHWEFKQQGEQNQISNSNPVGPSNTSQEMESPSVTSSHSSNEKTTAPKRKPATDVVNYRLQSMLDINNQTEESVNGIVKHVQGGDVMLVQQSSRHMTATPSFRNNPPLYQTNRCSGFETSQKDSELNTKPIAMSSSNVHPYTEYHETFARNQTSNMNQGAPENSSQERFSVSRKGSLPRNGRTNSNKKTNVAQDLSKCESLSSLSVNKKTGNSSSHVIENNIPGSDRTFLGQHNLRPMTAMPSLCNNYSRTYQLRDYTNSESYGKGMDGHSIDTSNSITYQNSSDYQQHSERNQISNSNRGGASNTIHKSYSSPTQAASQQRNGQNPSVNNMNISEELPKYRPVSAFDVNKPTQDPVNLPVNYNTAGERGPYHQQSARPMTAAPAYPSYPPAYTLPRSSNTCFEPGMPYLGNCMTQPQQNGFVQQTHQQNTPRYHSYLSHNPQNVIDHQSFYTFQPNSSFHPHNNFTTPNIGTHMAENPHIYGQNSTGFINNEVATQQNYNFLQNQQSTNTRYHPYPR